jgi:DnaJ-class molecular chaperone
LKKAFRAAAKKTHSDLTQKDTDGEFIKVKACYDALVNVAETDGAVPEGSVSLGMTTDGTPLFELGLGLGPMKNGRDCSRCDHKGYTEEKGIEWSFCNACRGTGEVPLEVPCRYCRKGKFRQKSGQVVDCNACRGTGKFKTTQQCWCAVGSGFRRSAKTTYRKCYECKGTGEIEILNPVIPKGRLFVRG